MGRRKRLLAMLLLQLHAATQHIQALLQASSLCLCRRQLLLQLLPVCSLAHGPLQRRQLLLQGCQALRLALSGLLGLALLLGCRRVPAGGEGGQWKEGEGDDSAAKTRGAASAEATQRMEALQASSPKPQACFPQAWRHAR